MIIDGKQLAREIISRLANRPTPEAGLTAFVMADDEQSFGFLRLKAKVAEGLGIEFKVKEIQPDQSTEAVVDMIKNTAADKTCGGIIVQLPLAGHLDKNSILDTIPTSKDIDVMNTASRDLFHADTSLIHPPAVSTTQTILKKMSFNITKCNVQVVGSGFLTGKPIADWLGNKAEKLSVLNRGDDLSRLADADLIITATGQPGLIDPAQLKDGGAVIDFGYGKKTKVDGSSVLMGDLDTTDSASLENLRFYTPTPGGTGPLLVAVLLRNFYLLNEAD